MSVKKLINPYALTKRAEKSIADIDKYFQDAESFGLKLAESDPNGELLNIRKALIAMIGNEKRIGRYRP